jgi:Fe-S-cluster containining protein
MPQSDLFIALEALYKELPEVNCLGCGGCCVSPTCTLVEFLYIMNHAQRVLPALEMEAIFSNPPRVHPDYEGNLHCGFLRNHHCSVHPARTGACRLFGLPLLREMGINDMVHCRNAITIRSGEFTLPALDSWLGRLYEIERSLYATNTEPYFIRGFNLACWQDIYFDPTLDFDIFADIKKAMAHCIDLTRFAQLYPLSTRLKEKVDKISILFSLFQSGDQATLRSLLHSIRDDYPLTGTYYQDDADAFLRVLEQAPAPVSTKTSLND